MNDEQLRHYTDKLAYEIDSWDLHVAMRQGEDLVVIDARSPESHQREHIPGALSLPHAQMSPESTATISKSALVVTYCDGIGCNGSTKGALQMVKLGFRVKELIGGIEWWKRDGHPVQRTEQTQESCRGDRPPGDCGCGP